MGKKKPIKEKIEKENTVKENDIFFSLFFFSFFFYFSFFVKGAQAFWFFFYVPHAFAVYLWAAIDAPGPTAGEQRIAIVSRPTAA